MTSANSPSQAFGPSLELVYPKYEPSAEVIQKQSPGHYQRPLCKMKDAGTEFPVTSHRGDIDRICVISATLDQQAQVGVTSEDD